MEDGIERMMTSDLYNIHFSIEKKNNIKEPTIVKEVIKEVVVKEVVVKEVVINPQ